MKTLQQVEPRTPIGQADIPFTIIVSGSYYLSEDLVAVGLNTSVISVNVDNVTLDLMGFTITGASEAAQATDGIRVLGTKNVVIRNGTIRACFSDGIDAASFGGELLVVEDIRAVENAVSGIRVGSRSVVRRCLAAQNGGHGIETQSDGAVVDCTAHENGDDGINVASGEVRDCRASRNTGDGIGISSDSRAINNYCDFNGNGGDGARIHVTGGGSRIEANSVTDNDRGVDVDGAGNLIVRNSSQSTVDYDIVAGNSAGPIVTSVSIATNENPHANYAQ